MRIELQEQVRKVAEVAAKVDAVTGADEVEEGDEAEPMTGKERIEDRIEEAREKSVKLSQITNNCRRHIEYNEPSVVHQIHKEAQPHLYHLPCLPCKFCTHY